jgi:hypothetical protein
VDRGQTERDEQTGHKKSVWEEMIGQAQVYTELYQVSDWRLIRPHTPCILLSSLFETVWGAESIVRKTNCFIRQIHSDLTGIVEVVFNTTKRKGWLEELFSQESWSCIWKIHRRNLQELSITNFSHSLGIWEDSESEDEPSDYSISWMFKPVWLNKNLWMNHKHKQKHITWES